MLLVLRFFSFSVPFDFGIYDHLRYLYMLIIRTSVLIARSSFLKIWSSILIIIRLDTEYSVLLYLYCFFTDDLQKKSNCLHIAHLLSGLFCNVRASFSCTSAQLLRHNLNFNSFLK